MSLSASVITEASELRKLESEWNALLTESASDTIFLTWEWISAWIDTVLPDPPLLVVVVRDPNGTLAAIAPFYLTTMRLVGIIPYRCLRILGDYCSGAEYADIILRLGLEADALRLVFRTLIKHRDKWDCIWMPNMASWTGARERIVECCSSFGFYCHERERDFALVDLPDNYSSYFRTLSKKRRSMLRRVSKKLFDGEKGTFNQCKSEEEREEYLHALFDLHHRRRYELGDQGTFVRKPAQVAFYLAFTRSAFSRGWLRLFAIKIRREFKAVQIGYVYGKTFCALQEGFDPSAISDIGNALRCLAIQTLIDEGVEYYDFLGQMTEHKRLWRSKVRKGYDLFIGCPGLKNRLLFTKNVWPSGRFIKESHPVKRDKG